MMKKIGFDTKQWEDAYGDPLPDPEFGYAEGESENPQATDFNNDMIQVINTIADIIARYKGSVKGVNIKVESKGEFSVKVEYNHG